MKHAARWRWRLHSILHSWKCASNVQSTMPARGLEPPYWVHTNRATFYSVVTVREGARVRDPDTSGPLS